MSDWIRYTLGELYGVHNGLSKASKFFGSGYPFISFKDVFNNYFLPAIPSGLVQSTEKERASFSIRRGDVLITRTSETHDELGMSSVALADYPHATYNGFTKRLRPKTEFVIPEFIGYCFRSPAFRAEFRRFSSMTTRASLKNEELLNIAINLPSIEEQWRIANALRSYDNLIENNRRQIALLEEAADLSYDEWRFRCNENAFSMGIASDFFDITIGKTPPRVRSECFASEGVPWASVKDLGIAGGPFLRETSECLTEEAVQAYSVKVKPAGTVLLSYKLTIGRIAILDQPSATNEAIAHFATDDDAVRLYTFEYLRHFDYESLGSTSSIGKAINSKIVKALPFAMPNRRDLEQLHELLSPVFENMRICQTRIELAREARDRLLPKLMSGEIEVA